MMQNDIPKHPSVILAEIIKEEGISQKDLAIRTGVSEKHISTILSGDKNISAGFSKKLDIALGMQKNYFYDRIIEFERHQLDVKNDNDVDDEEIDILNSMKEIVKYFIKKGHMHNNCGDIEKVLQLRELLCVNNLTAMQKITYNAAYRAQIKKNTNYDINILFAWQRLCELETRNLKCNGAFNKDMLKSKIGQIRMTIFEDDINKASAEIQKILAECGVIFKIVKNFKGAPVNGFIKRINNGSVIMCVTLYGKSADRIWFTLFHELGHLINDDLSVRFVDFESVNSDIEGKADEFASNTLIPIDEYRKFIKTKGFTELENIKEFSRRVKIPAWITIGRMKHDKWLEWSEYSDETPKYSWA